MFEEIVNSVLGISVLIFVVTGAALLFQLKQHEEEWWNRNSPQEKLPWLFSPLWRLGALATQVKGPEFKQIRQRGIRILAHLYLAAAILIVSSGIVVSLFRWVLN